MSDIITTRLSQELKRYRLEHQMTQEEMADVLGISKHSYYLWERKGRKPAIRHLVMLAGFLEKSLDEIIQMTENEQDA